MMPVFFFQNQISFSYKLPTLSKGLMTHTTFTEEKNVKNVWFEESIYSR
jgi:hypothetical protein